MKNATLCYLKVNDKILFLCRNRIASDIHSGLYVTPGGQTEKGERGIDCVLREFEQETGLKLVNPRLKAIVTFYNEGRVMGDKLSPEDWCVEVYTACEFFSFELGFAKRGSSPGVSTKPFLGVLVSGTFAYSLSVRRC